MAATKRRTAKRTAAQSKRKGGMKRTQKVRSYRRTAPRASSG